MSDARIERQRDAGLGDEIDRFGELPSEGGVTLLLQSTSAGAYPTVAGSFYACCQVDAEGSEVEGSIATFAADCSRVVYAYNLGSKVPPQGSRFLGHLRSGLWFFTWNV